MNTFSTAPDTVIDSTQGLATSSHIKTTEVESTTEATRNAIATYTTTSSTSLFSTRTNSLPASDPALTNTYTPRTTAIPSTGRAVDVSDADKASSVPGDTPRVSVPNATADTDTLTSALLDTETQHLVVNPSASYLPITTNATTDVTGITVYALNTTTPDRTTMDASAAASAIVNTTSTDPVP